VESIKRISIVGTGNVATQIVNALTSQDLELVEVCSANFDNAVRFGEKFGLKPVGQVQDLEPVDLILICVPDDSIQHVIGNLREGQLSAYTSGSVELEVFNREDTAVFYPLQTFSSSIEANWKIIPILIEANSKAIEAKLLELGNTISSVVRCVDSEYRKRLHVVAVWTNNFVNHILGNAQEIAGQLDVDFDLVLPLLEETIERIKTNYAFDIQTGPAIRGDQTTINKHKNLMTEDQSELYRIISESIINTHKRNEEL
jgi:predicted short-subunit dehydrogenase-like oxidoreductase (DUF2520 family)